MIALAVVGLTILMVALVGAPYVVAWWVGYAVAWWVGREFFCDIEGDP